MILLFVVQYIFCYLYNCEASSSGLGAYSLIRPSILQQISHLFHNKYSIYSTTNIPSILRPSIQQPSCLCCCFAWQDETSVVLVICSKTSFVRGLFKDVLFHHHSYFKFQAHSLSYHLQSLSPRQQKVQILKTLSF